MVTLRPFTPDDWLVLAQYQYPGMTESDAKKLISEFNTGTFQGHRCETLAVDNGSCIVGFVSLLAQEDVSASEGVEIYPPYRRRGYACEAVTALLKRAEVLGYQAVTAQIRQDNAASLALHKKLGFVVTADFINKRGNPVYSLEYSI